MNSKNKNIETGEFEPIYSQFEGRILTAFDLRNKKGCKI